MTDDNWLKWNRSVIGKDLPAINQFLCGKIPLAYENISFPNETMVKSSWV